jgi:hypothetical protein
LNLALPADVLGGPVFFSAGCYAQDRLDSLTQSPKRMLWGVAERLSAYEHLATFLATVGLDECSLNVIGSTGRGIYGTKIVFDFHEAASLADVSRRIAAHWWQQNSPCDNLPDAKCRRRH